MKWMTGLVLLIMWTGCEAQMPATDEEMVSAAPEIDVQGLAAEGGGTQAELPAKEIVIAPTEASAAMDFSEVAGVKQILPAEPLSGRLSLAAPMATQKRGKTMPVAILPNALQRGATTATALAKSPAAADQPAADLSVLLAARGLVFAEGLDTQGLYLKVASKPESHRLKRWGKK